MAESTKQPGPMQGRMIDFVPQKTVNDKAPAKPVMSAKDAINAMYAEQSQKVQPEPTVRELVNANGRVQRQQNSAATMHHGSIQKKVESVRTSASALLRVAKTKKPSQKETRPLSSFDPLAKPKLVRKMPKTKARPVAAVPVVRTSLKLGTNARPKPAPVVLPPNARMAQVARPVGAKMPATDARRPMTRRLVDAQIVPTKAMATQPKRTLASGTELAKQAIQVQPVQTPTKTPPQKTTAKPKWPQPAQTRPVTAEGAIAQQMGQVPKFRTAPKSYVKEEPETVLPDMTYVMAEPPKLTPKKPVEKAKRDDLGVVRNYHQSNEPQLLGDKAPIGRVAEQKVASGHGGAAKEIPKIKAENTSNYSFSRKLEPDANRYALGGQSPFLKSVNVEKRPLSDSAPRGATKMSTADTAITRKNVYAKKSPAETPRDLPTRPTVIVPSSHRSKAPLFFLIVITVLLGAAVGAAAYFCFFQ